MAVSFQCMTKFTTNKKLKKIKNKIDMFLIKKKTERKKRVRHDWSELGCIYILK